MSHKKCLLMAKNPIFSRSCVNKNRDQYIIYFPPQGLVTGEMPEWLFVVLQCIAGTKVKGYICLKRRCFHMEQPNQSQDSTDVAFMVAFLASAGDLINKHPKDLFSQFLSENWTDSEIGSTQSAQKLKLTGSYLEVAVVCLFTHSYLLPMTVLCPSIPAVLWLV